MCYATRKRLSRAAKMASWRLLIRAAWGEREWRSAKEVAALVGEPNSSAMAGRLCALGCEKRSTLRYCDRRQGNCILVLFKCPQA